MDVVWRKCVLSSKCRLNIINLDNSHFDNLIGVYKIWSNGNANKTICIGGGIIRNELNAMKKNFEVQNYGPDLYVTWAMVPSISIDGVLAFLTEKLKPMIIKALSPAEPIKVNLP